MKNDYGITNYKKWYQKETIGIIGRIIEALYFLMLVRNHRHLFYAK
jgi:hypothetical protein